MFCMSCCVILVTLDDKYHIVEVRSDRDDLMTTGYACLKGLQAHASYNAADRVLQPLKHQADGSFQPIPLEQALDEIAAKLRQIIDRNGPESVGGFRGAGAMLNAYATAMVP